MSAAGHTPPAEAIELSTHALGLVIGVADAYPGHEDTICIAGAIALLQHAKDRNPQAMRLFQIAFQHACATGII